MGDEPSLDHDWPTGHATQLGKSQEVHKRRQVTFETSDHVAPQSMWLTKCLVSSSAEYDAADARLQVNRPCSLGQREELDEGGRARGQETNKGPDYTDVQERVQAFRMVAGGTLVVPRGIW